MKKRMTLVGLIAATAGALALAGIIYSCGSGGGSASSGNVALYLTDDMSVYTQVTATINRIELRNTGSGASCGVFTGPLAVDITNLSGIMQLIDVSSCPAVPYNRIHIEFAKSVRLALANAGGASLCTFTSYLDGRSKPNSLTCGATACTLDINGAVNVLSGGTNKLALDFDLKNFSADNFGTPACQVTMKVSPLRASDMEKIGHPEAVSGLVSGLSTTDRTFTLTRGQTAFTVLYSGISGSQQPGLDTLLQRAQDDRLRAKVMTTDIDLAGRSVTASAITVKVEGTISTGSLDTTGHTFSIVYSSGSATRTIGIDYSKAVVDGTPAEQAWVDARLYGYAGGWFLARKAEVEDDGPWNED